MNIVEARVSELGYTLPDAPAAVGAYLPAKANLAAFRGIFDSIGKQIR